MEVKSIKDNIKDNIINNFLVPYYQFTVVRIKECVIGDIKRRSWFPCEYDFENDVLTFNVSNDTKVDIHFVFESKKSNTSTEDVFYLLNDFE